MVMPSFGGLTPWRAPSGQVPEYPRASNDTERGGAAPHVGCAPGIGSEVGAGHGRTARRMRRLVVEELAQLIKR